MVLKADIVTVPEDEFSGFCPTGLDFALFWLEDLVLVSASTWEGLLEDIGGLVDWVVVAFTLVG